VGERRDFEFGVYINTLLQRTLRVLASSA